MNLAIKIAAAVLVMFSCAKKDPHQEIENIIKTHAKTDINHFILDKFRDHRIIMLADAGHSEGVYQRTVSSFLKYWMDAAIDGRSPVKDLVLIREDDSLHIQDIKRYMVSHEYRDLIGNRPIDFYSWLSTADLEFYWELGDLVKKINQADSGGANIKFNILGPEMVLDLDNWTVQKRDEWFVNSRDTISSKAIISYLDANPETKALIFYGNAHMAKEKVHKPTKSGPSEGYYMAHYLDQEFGSNFYEIDQFEYVNPTGPMVTPGSSYVIEQKYYDELSALMNTPNLGTANVDAAIIKVGESELTVSWPFVKSKTLGWLSLEEIKTLIARKKLFHLNMGAECAFYLSMLTGDLKYIANRKDSTIIYKCVPAWEKWLGDPQNDVVNEIVALAPARHLLDLMKSAKEKDTEVEAEYSFTLTTGLSGTYNIRTSSAIRKTIAEQYDNEVDWPSKFEYEELLINKASNRIIVTDLVQLLWVGTDRERQKAVAQLQKRTGQNFTTAPEWMKWWRENYYSL